MLTHLILIPGPQARFLPLPGLGMYGREREKAARPTQRAKVGADSGTEAVCTGNNCPVFACPLVHSCTLNRKDVERIQISRPYFRTTESESLEVSPRNLYF